MNKYMLLFTFALIVSVNGLAQSDNQGKEKSFQLQLEGQVLVVTNFSKTFTTIGGPSLKLFSVKDFILKTTAMPAFDLNFKDKPTVLWGATIERTTKIGNFKLFIGGFYENKWQPTGGIGFGLSKN